MVAWWKGEGNTDDSVGSHTGQIPYGALVYSPGVVGQAFDFDNGQSVSVPDSPDFILTNEFSVEGWFYPRQASTGFIAIRGDDRPGLDPWTLVMLDTPGYLSFHIYGDSGSNVLIQAAVQTNQWQHSRRDLQHEQRDVALH